MRRLLVFYLLIFSSVTVNLAQNGAGKFAGDWNGVIVVGEQKIIMEFGIGEKEGRAVGTMSAQGVKGIPVEVTVSGDSLELQVKQLGMTYSGLKFGNNIMGTFSQHGFTTAMMLLPGKVQRNRPQTPKSPFPYSIEEVTFANDAEEAVLSGTLTYPVGYDKMKTRNVPVVVMVTGSGTQNRDEEVFDHKPFAVMADWLARNGIASLRYDDRGAGGSSKPVEGATSQNNAGDAKAAVEFVRGLKKFGKIGILGHSEGGTIAIMLAGERVPDFIISLAGVATAGVDCIVWQNIAQMEQNGVPEQMRNDYGKALRIIYAKRIQGGAIPKAKEFVQQMCAEKGLNLPAQFVANLEAVASLESPWIDWFVWYNPKNAIEKIKCPVMAINGSLDMQVPAGDNLEVLRSSLPQNGKHFIKEYPSKNHLFQDCTEATSLQYENIEQTIAPDVLEDIAKWIQSL